MTTTKKTLNWKNALGLAVLLSLFWCLIVFLGYTGAVNAKVEMGKTMAEMLVESGRQFIVNAILFFALFRFQFSVFNRPCKNKRKIWVLTVGSLSIVLVFVGMLVLTADVVSMKHAVLNKTIPNIFFIIAYAIIISAMTILLSSLFYISGEREKAILENQKLSVENMRARYETLKSQINPHFLFNSLNTLNGLISMDSERAREFVHQLSFVFRYSIQNREAATLNDELVCIEAFCNMMKIRYSESLAIEYRIDDRYRQHRIMPLSLQMLVENAIKHNTISKRYPLIITIETTDNNTVRVWNKIRSKNEDTSGEGIGLANMTERYKMLYQKDIAISSRDGVFSVEIPLIKGHR